MYRVTTAMGLNTQFPASLFSRAILTLIKLNQSLDPWNMINFCLCLSGLVMFPIQLYRFYNLLHDRKVVFEWFLGRWRTLFKDEAELMQKCGVDGERDLKLEVF